MRKEGFGPAISKMLFSGGGLSGSLCVLLSGPPRLPPGGGVQIGRKEDGVRHAFCPPTEAGGAVLPFFMAFGGR
jgi:hypothetical protein